MPFTDLFYENPSLVPAPQQSLVVKTVEAAEAPELEALIAAALAEVVAQNVIIAAAFPEQTGVLLTLGDFLLAGGGDGHTFVATLIFVPQAVNNLVTLLNLGSGALLPQNLDFTCALASEKDALNIAITNAATRAAGAEDTRVIFQALAGAAKGTRFMFAVGGIVEQA